MKVKVSRQAINAIETNKFDPSIWLAYDLAKFFNMALEDISDFEGSKGKFQKFDSFRDTIYQNDTYNYCTAFERS